MKHCTGGASYKNLGTSGLHTMVHLSWTRNPDIIKLAYIEIFLIIYSMVVMLVSSSPSWQS
jgi:hypothetical protein